MIKKVVWIYWKFMHLTLKYFLLSDSNSFSTSCLQCVSTCMQMFICCYNFFPLLKPCSTIQYSDFLIFFQVLRILATRAMNQATYFCTGCYTTDDFYHYGLGLDRYTHFTSPIRRYADILVRKINCLQKF